MIRPITCLAVVLACGSGLYLYQSKHRVKVLDEQIAETVKSTDTLREQTRMLSAEWTLLNDPERLRQLANQFLTLQTVSPGQFTSLADLDHRLPPPVPPGPPANAGAVAPAPSAPVPVASDGSSRTGGDDGKPAGAKLAEASPAASPKDAAPPAQAASPRIAVTAPVEVPHPADRKPPVPRLPQAQPRLAVSEPRLAEVRPTVAVPRAPAPAPMPQAGGSLLGMAHDMVSPPSPMPRPVPLDASLNSYGNGG